MGDILDIYPDLGLKRTKLGLKYEVQIVKAELRERFEAD